MSGFVPDENLYGKRLWSVAMLNELCQRHLNAVVAGICMASLLRVFSVSVSEACIYRLLSYIYVCVCLFN